jgi:glutathione S-transferase
MHLLYYAPGACSLAPHILLEEVGVPFEARAINLAEREQFSAAYQTINPRMRVPALVVDGTLVTEVPALLLYIASLRPGAGLVPAAGTLELAACAEFAAFLSSTVHVSYAQFRRPERFLPPDFAQADAVIEQGRKNTVRLYEEIESRLPDDGWMIGGRYSLIDPYLFPFYLWGFRLGLTMSRDCPRWTGLVDRLLERPAVARAVDREGIHELIASARA